MGCWDVAPEVRRWELEVAARLATRPWTFGVHGSGLSVQVEIGALRGAGTYPRPRFSLPTQKRMWPFPWVPTLPWLGPESAALEEEDSLEVGARRSHPSTSPGDCPSPLTLDQDKPGPL